MIVILFPMSWITSVASAFHDPSVSITTGMKMWVLVMTVILSSWQWRRCLLLLLLVERYYQGGTVRTYLIQLRPKPSVFGRAQGTNVAPSGHLTSSRDRPTGSLEAGT